MSGASVLSQRHKHVMSYEEEEDTCMSGASVLSQRHKLLAA